jgi:hypothetical protein
MPRIMYQLEGRAEGHLQGRSEHHIVLRWCRKFPNEPTPHKSVDYRVFKRGFQASRNQSRPLCMTFTK